MKKISIAAGIIVLSIAAISCNDKRDPGRAYMPDMYYSRAYETYGYNDVHNEYNNIGKRGIRYNALPVSGTMARGDAEAYPFPNNDSGYALSRTFTSAYDSIRMTPSQMKEAERLYLVNCAICHGTKLDGNGPLWKGGDGPFPAAPRPLNGDYAKKLADGTYYHVIQHGKGSMGSYASQLRPEQRWWVIKYIRSVQGPADSTQSSTTATDSTAATNSTATAKK